MKVHFEVEIENIENLMPYSGLLKLHNILQPIDFIIKVPRLGALSF